MAQTYSEELQGYAPKVPGEGSYALGTANFGAGAGNGAFGGLANPASDTSTDGKPPKSLGKYVFSRMGKELALSSRELADAKINRAIQAQPLFDAFLSKYMTLASADYRAGAVKTFSNAASDTAQRMAKQRGLVNSALGLSSAATGGYADAAYESAGKATMDFESKVYDPAYQMQQTLPLLGLLNDLGNPSFDWLRQLHGLTQDYNLAARLKGDGLGDSLGGVLGGLAGNAGLFG